MVADKADKLVSSNAFQSTTARGWGDRTTEGRNRADGRDSSRKRRLAFEALEAHDISFDISQSKSRNKKPLFKRFWTPEEVLLLHSGRTTKIASKKIWREELEENKWLF